MANKVANVDAVTEGLGGVALADRAPALAPSWAPALRDMRDQSARKLRSHLQRLPEAAPILAEEPLIETDTAPGFSALRQAAVGRGAISDMSVDPETGRLFVVNHVDNSVSVLDPVTLGTVSTVADVDEPFAITTAGGCAFVSTVTVSYDAITVLDPGAGEPAMHPLALSVRDIAASAEGRHVFVARSGRDGADVAVLTPADGRVTTIELGTRRGATAEAIAVSRDGARAYVVSADHLGGELVAIDTAAGVVIGGLAFDAPLRDVAVSVDGATVYVAGADAVIDIVDARRMRVTDTVDLGGTVTQLLLGATGERLYVVNGDRVSVICTATHEVVDAIAVVGEPSCIAESADGKRLFIADYDGGVTSLTLALSTGSLVAPDVIDVPMLELERVAG